MDRDIDINNNNYCVGEVLYAASYGSKLGVTQVFTSAIKVSEVWLDTVKKRVHLVCDDTAWADFHLSTKLAMQLEVNPEIRVIRQMCYERFCTSVLPYLGYTSFHEFLRRVFKPGYEFNKYDIMYRETIDALLEGVRFIVCVRHKADLSTENSSCYGSSRRETLDDNIESASAFNEPTTMTDVSPPPFNAKTDHLSNDAITNLLSQFDRECRANVDNDEMSVCNNSLSDLSIPAPRKRPVSSENTVRRSSDTVNNKDDELHIDRPRYINESPVHLFDDTDYQDYLSDEQTDFYKSMKDNVPITALGRRAFEEEYDDDDNIYPDLPAGPSSVYSRIHDEETMDVCDIVKPSCPIEVAGSTILDADEAEEYTTNIVTSDPIKENRKRKIYTYDMGIRTGALKSDRSVDDVENIYFPIDPSYEKYARVDESAREEYLKTPVINFKLDYDDPIYATDPIDQLPDLIFIYADNTIRLIRGDASSDKENISRNGSILRYRLYDARVIDERIKYLAKPDDIILGYTIEHNLEHGATMLIDRINIGENVSTATSELEVREEVLVFLLSRIFGKTSDIQICDWRTDSFIVNNITEKISKVAIIQLFFKLVNSSAGGTASTTTTRKHGMRI